MDATIHGTPDGWGSQTWFYNDSMIDETIAALKREFPEYADDYTADDCSTWELVKSLDETSGLYKEAIRKPNYVVFRKIADGEYAPDWRTQATTEQAALD